MKLENLYEELSLFEAFWTHRVAFEKLILKEGCCWDTMAAVISVMCWHIYIYIISSSSSGFSF